MRVPVASLLHTVTLMSSSIRGLTWNPWATPFATRENTVPPYDQAPGRPVVLPRPRVNELGDDGMQVGVSVLQDVVSPPLF